MNLVLARTVLRAVFFGIWYFEHEWLGKAYKRQIKRIGTSLIRNIFIRLYTFPHFKQKYWLICLLFCARF